MNTQYFRGSSLNSYDDCQFKYGLIYDCGLPSKSGKKACLGTIAHKVLEDTANAVRDKVPPESPEILLKRAWKEQLEIEPWHEMEDADYRFCTKQINNVLNSDYSPTKLDIIDTEVQFQIKVNRSPFNGHLELRGTMDLLYKIDDTTIGVQDYKTGKVSNWDDGSDKTLDDYDEDAQFSLYDIVLEHMYPQYKNRMFTVLFTQKMQPFTFAYTEKHRQNTWERLRRKFYEIGSNNNPIRLKDDPLRTGEKFKCINVCSFGRDQRCIYQSMNTGKTTECVLDKKHVQPVFEDGEDIWELQHQETMCDYLHNLRSGKAFSDAKELIQLSVNGKYDIAVSKRNDYSNPKIYKGVIK